MSSTPIGRRPKCMPRWASPEARGTSRSRTVLLLTECTSRNPSACSSSSATYCGATQRPRPWTSLSVVVSGGGSAGAGLGCKPRNPAVPTSVNPPRNLRRLNCLACWVLMGISLPAADQCDTENAVQWNHLPSHTQAQHLDIIISDGSADTENIA